MVEALAACRRAGGVRPVSCHGLEGRVLPVPPGCLRLRGGRLEEEAENHGGESFVWVGARAMRVHTGQKAPQRHAAMRCWQVITDLC